MDAQSPPYAGDLDCTRYGVAVAFLVLSILTVVVASVLVPLRLYTRLWIIHGFWWDDVLIIAAYILSIAGSAVLWRIYQLGLGTHLGCSPIEDVLKSGRLYFQMVAVVVSSQIASRASVALFVTRIFAVTKPVRNLLYIFAVWMAISLLVTVTMNQYQCRPIESIWNPALADTAVCWSMQVQNFISYYNGAVGIFSDFVLALLPVYFLVKLQMSTERRTKLIALMGIGLLPGICAILRTALTFTGRSQDVIYFTSVEALVGHLETMLLIIAATIPTLPPFFKNENRRARCRPSRSDFSLLFNFSPSSQLNDTSKNSSSVRKSGARVVVAQNVSIALTDSPSEDAFEERSTY